jgi:hypothetical protein
MLRVLIRLDQLNYSYYYGHFFYLSLGLQMNRVIRFDQLLAEIVAEQMSASLNQEAQWGGVAGDLYSELELS